MKRLLSTVILSAMVAAPLQSSFAEEAVAPKAWKNSAEAAMVTTNGNSKATSTSVKNTFNYKWTKTGLEIVGAGYGSSSGNQITSEQYLGNEKLTYNYTEKNYVYEKFGWEKNRFAKIENRWDGSAGLGRNILSMANDTLDGELGGGYINEERKDSPRNDFGSGRAYAKYVHLFSPSANISQDGEYLHNFKDSDGYRLNTETALTTALSTHLSFKTSFIWNRVGKPAPGTGKDDTKFMVGLIVNY